MDQWYRTTVKSGTEVEIDLSLSGVSKYQPFRRWLHSSPNESEIRDAVETFGPQLNSHIRPRAAFRIVPQSETNIESYDPPEPILTSEWIAVGVVTVGGEEAVVDPSGEPFRDLIRDSLENVALIQAREFLAHEIKDIADENEINTTRLITPGQKQTGWPLENIKFVFDALDAERIDVTLEKNTLPNPKKTYSFVMGLETGMDQPPNLLSCEECPKIDNCPYVGTVV